MDEPRTHYQLSFTARQALALFVGFLLSLAVAYFLGVMTGLAGRVCPDVAGAPTRAPTARASASKEMAAVRPTPAAASRTILASRAAPNAAAAPGEPTRGGALQLFEDRGEAESAPTPSPPSRASASAAGTEQFWVQVISMSSEKEAKARSARLRQHRWRTSVVSASTPKGIVYRVRVGPYTTKQAAERAAGQLQSRENVRPWVVAEKP